MRIYIPWSFPHSNSFENNSLELRREWKYSCHACYSNDVSDHMRFAFTCIVTFSLSLLHTICIYRFLSPSYDFCTNSKESKQKNIAQRDRSCNYRYEKRNIYNFILSRIYISYSNEQYFACGVENPMKNFFNERQNGANSL